MIESKDNDLSMDELKDVSGGGFKGEVQIAPNKINWDAQCDDKMGQARAFRKMENHPTFTKKADKWSGTEMQDN